MLPVRYTPQAEKYFKKIKDLNPTFDFPVLFNTKNKFFDTYLLG